METVERINKVLEVIRGVSRVIRSGDIVEVTVKNLITVNPVTYRLAGALKDVDVEFDKFGDPVDLEHLDLRIVHLKNDVVGWLHFQNNSFVFSVVRTSDWKLFMAFPVWGSTKLTLEDDPLRTKKLITAVGTALWALQNIDKVAVDPMSGSVDNVRKLRKEADKIRYRILELVEKQ
jgi:hypothetical protein